MTASCCGGATSSDAEYARNAGLLIENMHAPVHEQNALSKDDLEGESVYRNYLSCVDDCRAFDIPTVVIHLPDDDFPLNEKGFERLERIVCKAGDLGVNIAFENLRNVKNLARVMERFTYPHTGFCYDSCHHANYAPDTDLLAAYGNRLKALHLHDNGGERNQHRLPFDGNVDRETVIGRIRETGCGGAVTLEPMNWDYTDMDIKGFLGLAHGKAEILEKRILG